MLLKEYKVKTKNTDKFIISLLISISISILSGCWPSYTLPEPDVKHIAYPEPSMKEIWSQTIYAMQDDRMSPLDAASGIVCFVGALTSYDDHDVFCLDGLTGKILWQNTQGASKIQVTNDAVYLARSGGFTGVGKFNVDDGSFLWYKGLKGSGISHMSVFNQEVQVLAVPDGLFGLDIATGKITQQYSDQINTFVHTDVDTFVLRDNFKAISNVTEEVLWAVNLIGVLKQVPIVLDKVVLVRTGGVMGVTYGINRKSGDVLWETGDNIISNVAYSLKNEKAYMLTKEGDLLSIDMYSGKKEILIKFSSVPFSLNSPQVVGGYELAFNDSIGMIFILLGDSRQLIAFQENKSP